MRLGVAMACAATVGCGPTDEVCNADFDARRSQSVGSDALTGSFVLQPEVPQTLEFQATMDDLPTEMTVIESVRYPAISFDTTFAYAPGDAPPGQAEFPTVTVEVTTRNYVPAQQSNHGSQSFSTRLIGQCEIGQDFCATSLRLTFLQDDPLYPDLDVSWRATGSITVAHCFDVPTLPTLELERTE
jgi:hypothetical protein